LRPRHARGAFALLAIAALALTCDNALAAAGGLDPAFDADGKRVLPDSGRPAAVLAQRDGKVVVAGTDAAGDFAVWRLKANGALDAIRFRLSEPARVRLRRLAAGRYRLTATARDAAGNAARPRRATFRLIHR
jgi:hypothetical protein